MEMDKLKNTVGYSDKSEKSSFNWSDLLVNPGRWAFIMAIGLGVLYELCGVVAMLNYTGIIFQETGSNLSPDVSAIIVGAIQFIGSLVTTNLADRAGRKVVNNIVTVYRKMSICPTQILLFFSFSFYTFCQQLERLSVCRPLAFT